jgi:hypothetical protein
MHHIITRRVMQAIGVVFVLAALAFAWLRSGA